MGRSEMKVRETSMFIVMLLHIETNASTHSSHIVDINLQCILNLFVEFVLSVSQYSRITFVHSRKNAKRRGPVNWVKCDSCPRWYHTVCVGVRNTTAPYHCDMCRWDFYNCDLCCIRPSFQNYMLCCLRVFISLST